jgi:predicted TPR repeat methyltransferase
MTAKPTPLPADAESRPARPCVDALAAGYALRAAGLDSLALARFAALIARDPTDAGAWRAYGETLRDLDKPGPAAAAFARAAALQPACVAHVRAWAEALEAAGDRASAIAVYERLLAQWPGCRLSHLALGRLLRAAGRTEDAACHLREAAFLDANDGAAPFELGLVLLDQGDLAAAIDALQKTLRQDPDFAPAHFHLGRAWTLAADVDTARARFQRYLALAPDDPLGARAHLDRLARGPESLAPAYVRGLFDQYAARFDADVVETLGYRGPEVLADALARVLGPATGTLEVLDLGCGTGLAGLALRPFARRLEGVDLSPNMIAKAETRGIYDKLLVGDMVAAVAGVAAAWDLIVAADALAYLGDLGPLFVGVRRALKAGGTFAALVEESPDTDVQWQPSRRFAHGADYLRRTAAAATGFGLALLEPAQFRREKGVPVPGLVFVLRAG